MKNWLTPGNRPECIGGWRGRIQAASTLYNVLLSVTGIGKAVSSAEE
ncbi:hypothetical protein [Enterocloster clostridioformis]|nr:hypothetical protein [Enterocloster clostridioformis]